MYYQIRQKDYKRAKYNNQTTMYNGFKYDSMKEANFARDLDLRIKAKDIKSWERQVKVELKVNGKLICNYYLDFKITENDGSITWAEVKGFATDTWILKRKLFEALLEEIEPGSQYVVVK